MKILTASLQVLLSIALLSQPVFAQDDVMHGAASESLTLKVGDIFEILPVHDLPQDSSYTWILTQDRTFLEATRAPIFRKRLIQPGVYTLFADIVSPDGSRRITRTFTINYQARQPGEPMAQNGSNGSDALVTTEPPLDSMGRTALPKETQLVRLNPINPDITPLALDLDLNRDADGDGSNDNDIQGNDTFFASDATPLYLWITDESLSRHPISVTASLPDGAKVQKIEILEESLAKAEGVVQGPVSISAEQTSGRSYRFSAVFQGTTPASGQLLYQWQFGDGQQSLVNAPEHEYADDGEYTVQLLIRNLRDGKEMANTSTTVNVSGSDNMPSSEPSQNSSEDDEEPTDNGGSSFNLRSILILIGVFVGSLVVGAIVMTVISLLRRNKGSMAKKIEELERAVVKTSDSAPAPLTITPPAALAQKPTPAPAPVTPAPQQKPQTPPPEIAKREEERATSNPVTQPAQTVNAKAAPAWLQPARPADRSDGQPAPKPVTPPAPAPKPAPAAQPKPQQPAQPVVPPSPKPTPAPQQQAPRQPTPAPQTPKQQNRPTPAWLQQPAPVTPAPQAQPKPAQPVVPPMPKPAPAPTPVSQPKPQPVPPAPVQPPMSASAVSTIADKPAPKPTEPVAVPPVQAQTLVAPKPEQNTPKSADQVIPADQPIAIIRAESLNPDQQNG